MAPRQRVRVPIWRQTKYGSKIISFQRCWVQCHFYFKWITVEYWEWGTTEQILEIPQRYKMIRFTGWLSSVCIYQFFHKLKKLWGEEGLRVKMTRAIQISNSRFPRVAEISFNIRFFLWLKLRKLLWGEDSKLIYSKNAWWISTLRVVFKHFILTPVSNRG